MKLPHISPQRVNDVNLMDTFIQQGYKKTQLASLNRCRMYLKVIWLSDITSVDGKSIEPTKYKGIDHSNYQSRYSWPPINDQSPQNGRSGDQLYDNALI